LHRCWLRARITAALFLSLIVTFIVLLGRAGQTDERERAD
jgi:hypothetical protein